MSKYFTTAGTTLWNPSNGAASLYVQVASAMSAFAGVPSGIGPVVADEHEVAVPEFSAFVDTLVRLYRSTNHPIMLSMIDGFLATSIVMVQRADGALPALSAEPVPPQRDISATGVPAPGVQRLVELAAVHARAMPA